MSKWIPRYLIAELQDGSWGLIDQSHSVLQPVQTFATQQDARAALEQVADEEIIDPTAISDDDWDAWEASGEP